MSEPATLLKVAAMAAKMLGPLVAQKYREHKRAQLEEACETLAGELLHARSEADVKQITVDAEPAAFDLLEEYFQTWAQAIEPAARPYSARLAALYLGEKRARDRAFRRTAALLISIDAPDLHLLISVLQKTKDLLAEAKTKCPTLNAERTAIIVRDDGNERHSLLVVELDGEEHRSHAGAECRGSVASVNRLLHDHRMVDLDGTPSEAWFSRENMSLLHLLVWLFAR